MESHPSRSSTRAEDEENWGYYDTLDVDPEASVADIKKAFRKMARKCHPDKNPKSPERANAEFKKIQEAYEVLKDRSQRTKYNLKIGYYKKLRKRQQRESARRRREVMKEYTNMNGFASVGSNVCEKKQRWTPDKGSVWRRYMKKSERKPSSEETAGFENKAFGGYKDYLNEKNRISEEFDEFADNVSKIQEKWRTLHAEAKAKFPKRSYSRPATPLSEAESVTSPPPPPPPPTSSPPPPECESPDIASSHSIGNEEVRSHGRRSLFDSPVVTSANRRRDAKASQKPRGSFSRPWEGAAKAQDSPATVKLNEHIQLLERLKNDQRKVVDKQLHLCRRRQEFWQKYRMEAGTKQAQKETLRRRFHEQSRRMEAMKERFDIRRRFASGRRSALF